MLTITQAAEKHFNQLIAKEEVPEMNLRIFVANPGTIHADIGVTFCPPGEEETTDECLNFNGFNVYIEESSKEYLVEAVLDYEENINNEDNPEKSFGGGQLAIKAPHLKGRKPKADSPLSERLNYVLNSEINPNLASHGGKVSLVEILEGGIVLLRFGGGCHGCGMANVTLKHGIENTLKEKFPDEINEVRDMTDHALGENPYY